MDPDPQTYFRVLEILPNTKRTQEKLKKQKEEEDKRRRERELLERQQKDMLQQQQKYEREQEQLKKLAIERQREEERRKLEEQQEFSNLKGEFGYMINDLRSGQSRLDYTISGLDLRPQQIQLLVKETENNTTLKGLSMCRKRITDKEGVELIQNLENNKVLERLELEGNSLGPETITQLAKLLSTNRSIRCIDLENNNLTNYGLIPVAAKINPITDNKQQQQKIPVPQDNSGLIALFETLKTNDTLLYLNLCNCRLDEECGKKLVEALKENTTLICVDIEENSEMGLREIREIQDLSLKRNKKEYDDERYREFKERKRLSKEEQISTTLVINKEAKELAQEGIDARIQARQQELDRQWKEDLEKEQKIREKVIHNLQKQAKTKSKTKPKAKPKAK